MGQRVLELLLEGVEQEARGTSRPVVERVSHNGKAQVGKVNADLVLAAAAELHGQEAAPAR